MNLKDLQQWVKEDWERCSLASPTPEQQLLYLVEEVGEIAEAIRKNQGNKGRIDKQVDLGAELADTLISLVTIANTHEIDLANEVKQFKNRLIERHNQGF